MKIALVILNWNGQKLLKKFIPSIVEFSQLPNVEIYIADNASTDNSIEFIKQTYLNIHIIQNQINGGFAKGYNDALQHISADVYGLINSDIEVTKNWLLPILSKFEADNDTVIIQPKILDFKNKNKFEYAGAAGGFIDKYGFPFCRGRIFLNLEEDLGQFNTDTEIFWASGACFFIRSKTFHEHKGFDELYFAHQEEIDLCWRVKNTRKKIVYVANSKVYHVGGATLNEGSTLKTFLNFRNSLFSLVKNLPKNQLFTIIFTRLVLDGFAGIKFLINLKPQHTLAIIKAHFSFYKHLNSMLKKRQKTNQIKDYFWIKSIVIKHYLFGKQKFNDLK